MSNHNEDNVVEFYEYIYKRTREGVKAIKFDQLMYMKLWLDEASLSGATMEQLSTIVDNFKKIMYED